MDAAVRKIKLKAEQTSANAAILTLVTTVGSMAVGLAWISNAQECALVATTTPAIVLAGVFANIFHTGEISPSAVDTAVMAFFGQVAADIVAFVPNLGSTMQLVIPLVSAAVLCLLQGVHVLFSRKVPPQPVSA